MTYFGNYLGAGPILPWFMVDFQQTLFQVGRELIQTGLFCLLSL